VVTPLLTSSALAAPSGDEYLPKVPKAAGKEVVGNPEQGAGASVLEPTIRGASSSSASEGSSGSSVSSGSSGSTTDEATKQEKQPAAEKRNRQPTQAPIVPASAEDDSSGSTLFNPIILLVIAGVVAAAVGMTLRRRQGEERAGRGQAVADEAKGPRPTPDGEIVAGGDEAA
jgi:hypothetical protein